jgi:hypothetical protein
MYGVLRSMMAMPAYYSAPARNTNYRYLNGFLQQTDLFDNDGAQEQPESQQEGLPTGSASPTAPDLSPT